MATTKTQLAQYLVGVTEAEKWEAHQEAFATAIKTENHFREVFATDRANTILDDPCLYLLPLFDTDKLLGVDKQTCDKAFVYRTLFAQEQATPKTFSVPSERRPPAGQSAFATRQGFERCLSALSFGSLDGLDWNNVFLAGGSVLACLQRLPEEVAGYTKSELRQWFEEGPYGGSDLDLFVYGLNEEDAKQKLMTIYKTVCDNIPFPVMAFRSAHAISLVSQHPYRHIQIVVRLYRSPAEVLMGFDVDACAFGYNGSNVYCTPRAHHAVVSQYNTIDMSRRSPSYETRLAKYAARGFEVLVPDLDRSRIDPQLFEKPFYALQGLARLLVLEKFTDREQRLRYLQQQRLKKLRPGMDDRTGRSGRLWKQRWNMDRAIKDRTEWLIDNDASDYSTVFLPWGPGWDAARIAGLMRKKDHLLNLAFYQPNKKRHTHPCFIGTMDEVLNDCCGNCDMSGLTEDDFAGGHSRRLKLKNKNKNKNKQKEKEQKAKDDAEDEEDEEVDLDKFVAGPLQFITDNPGRQMIGSFHPITDGDWRGDIFLSKASEAICVAISKDDIDSLRTLIEGEEDANVRDPHGRSGLHIAALCGSEKAFAYLLSVGAKISARMHDGRTALHVAAAYGQEEIVRLFIQELLRLRKIEEAKQQELEAKRAQQQAQMEEQAVQKTGTEKMKKKDIVRAARQAEKERKEVERMLDIDTGDWDCKMSALHYAIVFGHINVVSILLESGASVTKVIYYAPPSDEEVQGSSQYHRYVPGVVQTQIGFSVTSLYLASLFYDEQVAFKIASLLIQNGASSSLINHDLFTVLHCAVFDNNLEFIKFLFKADPSAFLYVNQLGGLYALHSPLSLAVAANNVDITRFLLEKGAQIVVDPLELARHAEKRTSALPSDAISAPRKLDSSSLDLVQVALKNSFMEILVLLLSNKAVFDPSKEFVMSIPTAEKYLDTPLPVVAKEEKKAASQVVHADDDVLSLLTAKEYDSYTDLWSSQKDIYFQNRHEQIKAQLKLRITAPVADSKSAATALPVMQQFNISGPLLTYLHAQRTRKVRTKTDEELKQLVVDLKTLITPLIPLQHKVLLSAPQTVAPVATAETSDALKRQEHASKLTAIQQLRQTRFTANQSQWGQDTSAQWSKPQMSWIKHSDPTFYPDPSIPYVHMADPAQRFGTTPKAQPPAAGSASRYEIVDPIQLGRCIDLMDAAWTGDIEKLNRLTVGEPSQRKKISVTFVHYFIPASKTNDKAPPMTVTPLLVAVMRRNYKFAERVLELAAEQYQPFKPLPPAPALKELKTLPPVKAVAPPTEEAPKAFLSNYELAMGEDVAGNMQREMENKKRLRSLRRNLNDPLPSIPVTVGTTAAGDSSQAAPNLFGSTSGFGSLPQPQPGLSFGAPSGFGSTSGFGSLPQPQPGLSFGSPFAVGSTSGFGSLPQPQPDFSFGAPSGFGVPSGFGSTSGFGFGSVPSPQPGLVAFPSIPMSAFGLGTSATQLLQPLPSLQTPALSQTAFGSFQTSPVSSLSTGLISTPTPMEQQAEQQPQTLPTPSNTVAAVAEEELDWSLYVNDFDPEPEIVSWPNTPPCFHAPPWELLNLLYTQPLDRYSIQKQPLTFSIFDLAVFQNATVSLEYFILFAWTCHHRIATDASWHVDKNADVFKNLFGSAPASSRSASTAFVRGAWYWAAALGRVDCLRVLIRDAGSGLISLTVKEEMGRVSAFNTQLKSLFKLYDEDLDAPPPPSGISSIGNSATLAALQTNTAQQPGRFGSNRFKSRQHNGFGGYGHEEYDASYSGFNALVQEHQRQEQQRHNKESAVLRQLKQLQQNRRNPVAFRTALLVACSVDQKEAVQFLLSNEPTQLLDQFLKSGNAKSDMNRPALAKIDPLKQEGFDQYLSKVIARENEPSVAANQPAPYSVQDINYISCDRWQFLTELSLDKFWNSFEGPEILDEKGEHIYHYAFSAGHDSVVELLSKTLPQDISQKLLNISPAQPQGRMDTRPLFVACYKNRVTAVRALVRCGSDVFIQDQLGLYPIHYALAQNHIEVIQVLIEELGAESVRTMLSRRLTSQQLSPLMLAATRGYLKICEMLLADDFSRLEDADSTGDSVVSRMLKPEGEGASGDFSSANSEWLKKALPAFLTVPTNLTAPTALLADSREMKLEVLRQVFGFENFVGVTPLDLSHQFPVRYLMTQLEATTRSQQTRQQAVRRKMTQKSEAVKPVDRLQSPGQLAGESAVEEPVIEWTAEEVRRDDMYAALKIIRQAMNQLRVDPSDSSYPRYRPDSELVRLVSSHQQVISHADKDLQSLMDETNAVRGKPTPAHRLHQQSNDAALSSFLLAPPVQLQPFVLGTPLLTDTAQAVFAPAL